ncbi:MAG: hypothetical protein JXA93_15655 [Anaerolineae bacterium]|nr:hypothetical protein [Anaerolineae bacterium]
MDAYSQSKIEPRARRTDLVMDYHELRLAAPPALFERDGQPWEQVHGLYCSRRLRFVDAHIVDGAELCTCLGDLPPDDPARALTGAPAWLVPDGHNYYLFDIRGEAYPSLLLIARSCVAEEGTGPTEEATFARRWSTPPLSPARLVPNPRRLRARYGGDPISTGSRARASSLGPPRSTSLAGIALAGAHGVE